ncbi:lipase family protein [Paenibacillus sp. M1]|uniref:Lipase family protein n=1 Tax=Paenibacillus haidiansis TaxID=1574488 RepID=A0ABU7VU86_9BACL
MGSNDAVEQRAIFLAAICGQTYEQYSNADGAFVVPWNFSVRHTIEAKSFIGEWERFGFTIESPEEVIIAFRGTSSAPDWVSDLIASQTKFKYIEANCLTHRGFTNIYASARDGIMAALAKISSGESKTLYVTGHSLGAALATLCAVDVAANTGFRSPILFTFGSPRVGDPAFAKAFASHVPASYRYANVFDIVTFAPPTVYKLPKRDKKFYYQHVRTLSSLDFEYGAISLNHVISSYFDDLSKLQPAFTGSLCSNNPGLCPVRETTVKK